LPRAARPSLTPPPCTHARVYFTLWGPGAQACGAADALLGSRGRGRAAAALRGERKRVLRRRRRRRDKRGALGARCAAGGSLYRARVVARAALGGLLLGKRGGGALARKGARGRGRRVSGGAGADANGGARGGAGRRAKGGGGPRARGGAGCGWGCAVKAPPTHARGARAHLALGAARALQRGRRLAVPRPLGGVSGHARAVV
jgi:hypothetical protein